MNPILMTFGMLLIATALTLMASNPRTWLVAFSQGLGVQAFVGGVISSVQVGWMYEGADKLSMSERVVMAVQGIPFHAAGWTGRSVFERITEDTHAGAMNDLNQFLAVGAVQMVAVGGIIAWRKMQDEALCDMLCLLVMGLVVANGACNAGWSWWAA